MKNCGDESLHSDTTHDEATLESVFDRAMHFVLRWEGGYVNHPNDPGGATNKGVTQNVYHKWLQQQGRPIQNVIHITDEEVHEIYFQNYWKTAKCDELDGRDSLQTALFDTAINMGTRRAILILQEAIGVTVDGIFGPKTRHAALTSDLRSTLEYYCDIRERVYRYLARAKPKLSVFLRGWLNRLNALRSNVGLAVSESVLANATPGTEPMGHLGDLPDSEFLESWANIKPTS